MTEVQTFDKPIYLYFTQGKKGLTSQLFPGGPMLFVNRNCKLEPGFVSVNKIVHKETYGFVEGTNVESLPIELSDVKDFFLLWLHELNGIFEGETTDGVDVTFLKFSGFNDTKRILFKTPEGEIEEFYVDYIQRYSQSADDQNYGILIKDAKPVFEEDFKNLKETWLLYKSFPLLARYYDENLSKQVEQNPLLAPFKNEIEKGDIHMIDLTCSYEIQPRYKFRIPFFERFLAFCPIRLEKPSYRKDLTLQMLQNILEYNKKMVEFWKNEGLSALDNDLQREAVEKELQKINFWND